MPDASGAPTTITGPASVKYRLWHAGKYQRLRFTPTRRKVSARYGKPQTFGLPAIARCCASCSFSIAALIMSPLILSV